MPPTRSSRVAAPAPAGSFAPLPAVGRRSRLRGRAAAADAAASARPAGLLVPALMGGIAALVTVLVRLPLHLPGHQILFAGLPVALGLALAPRRGAGSAAGVGAAIVSGACLLGGLGHPGAGALAGVVALGPALDLALLLAARGRRLYGAFALAGVGANGAAFVARSATRLLGDVGRGGALARWWPHALVSYLAFGLLAGVLSAALCFRARDPGEPGGDGRSDRPGDAGRPA